MFSNFSSTKLPLIAVIFALFFSLTTHVRSQTDDQAERQRAYELFANQQFLQALPLLEKLAVSHPRDGGVIARLGFALLARSQTIREPEKRKSDRARARAMLLKAQELGTGDSLPADLIAAMIASLPADGSENVRAKFSANQEANEAMMTGEAAFVNGDLNGALVAYQRALQLDPKLYEAPLFAGDMYLKKKDHERAGEWYARAIEIDPDRETAYRYWGNSLFARSWLHEARDKYIEAIIADPYNAYVWNNGLLRWANAKDVALANPRIEIPASIATQEGKGVTITVDPKALDKTDDGSSAWVFYGLVRAAWTMEKFAREFPEEKEYRHTLKEEVEALRGVLEALRNLIKEGVVKQPLRDLKLLLKLEEENLLEAYVLFARADQGIARDYESYRKNHRDKLREYLRNYVASGKY